MTSSNYDAIIVGARCAGSPTAMLLARKGHRVLVVDRAMFPSNTISTHFVTPDGVALLKEWGLLDRIMATGLPKLDIEFFINDFSMKPPTDSPDMFGIAPRRDVIDTILVEAAREAGAEVREGVSVREVIIEDGRARGIRGKSADGADFEARAEMVVGADGTNSMVARAVGAQEYNVHEGTTGGFYSYYEGIDESQGFARIAGKKAFFFFPTNFGQVCIGSEWQASEFPRYKQDPEEFMLSAFEQEMPELGAKIRKGRRVEEKMFGMLTPPAFMRKAAGPGWALVGDAGIHKDPITGRGMTDAFRDAVILADAVDAGLTGARPMDEALAAYGEQRDAQQAMMYGITNALASLDPAPEFIEMMKQFVAQRTADMAGTAAAAGS